MDEFDFECKDNQGRTVFQACFSRLLSILDNQVEHENLLSTNFFLVELFLFIYSEVIEDTENAFLYLLELADEIMDEEDVDKILENPSNYGQAVICLTSALSEKLTDKLLERNVRVNNVDNVLQTGAFNFKNLTYKLLKKGVNPKITDFTGVAQLRCFTPAELRFSKIQRNGLKES